MIEHTLEATIKINGYAPVKIRLAKEEKARFRVECNLFEWHVIDSELEPEGNDSVGTTDSWSIGSWTGNRIGQDIAEAKANHLCTILNELHAKSKGNHND